MDDLVAFLRARLDEDEAVARAATDGPWETWEGRELHGLGDLIHPVRTPGQMMGSRATIVAASWLDAEHIARHDPARVLRDVERDRKLIEAHHRSGQTCPRCSLGTEDGQVVFERDPCETLRLLALPYSDHPDYREEWQPRPGPARHRPGLLP